MADAQAGVTAIGQVGAAIGQDMPTEELRLAASLLPAMVLVAITAVASMAVRSGVDNVEQCAGGPQPPAHSHVCVW